MGMTNLLLDTDLNPDQRELTDVVITSSQQLLGIVTHILQMTQLEAGQVIIETTEFHPKESLTIAVETIRPHAEVCGLQVLVIIDPALPALCKAIRSRFTRFCSTCWITL
jgi:two-component system, sensor histidine kinase and response regulator